MSVFPGVSITSPQAMSTTPGFCSSDDRRSTRMVTGLVSCLYIHSLVLIRVREPFDRPGQRTGHRLHLAHITLEQPYVSKPGATKGTLQSSVSTPKREHTHRGVLASPSFATFLAYSSSRCGRSRAARRRRGRDRGRRAPWRGAARRGRSRSSSRG